MNLRLALGLSIALWSLIIGVVSCANHAHGQGHEGHAGYHDAYSEWMQPYPHNNVSCCNGRKDVNGELVGDCYPTEFLPITDKDGQLTGWAALLDPRTNEGKREYVPLPEDKRVREKNPDPSGVSGHICESIYHTILCWVPPTGTN